MRAVAAADAANAEPTGQWPFTKMRCEWLLLAGDSNSRFLFQQIESHLTSVHRYKRTFSAPPEGRFQWEVMLNRSLTPKCRAALPLAALGDKAGISGVKLVVKNGCDLHWFDREARFERNGRCVHVSLRFLMRQHESTRLLHRGDFEAPRACPFESYRRSPKARTTDVNFSNPLCSRARHFDLDGCRPLADGALPPRPTLTRLSHGLWGVPRNLTNCSTRFEAELRVLRRLGQLNAPTVWVTNFPIAHHKSITNSYLRSEAACQRTQIRALRASMAADPKVLLPSISDLWARAEAKDGVAHDGGFHLSSATLRRLANETVARLLAPPPPPGGRRLAAQRHPGARLPPPMLLSLGYDTEEAFGLAGEWSRRNVTKALAAHGCHADIGYRAVPPHQKPKVVIFMIVVFMVLAAIAALALVWCAALMVRWARHQPS